VPVCSSTSAASTATTRNAHCIGEFLVRRFPFGRLSGGEFGRFAELSQSRSDLVGPNDRMLRFDNAVRQVRRAVLSIFRGRAD